MKGKQRGLSKRVKSFCRFYSNCTDAEMAAKMAGIPDPSRSGLLLLDREEVTSELKRLYHQKLVQNEQRVMAGYERLAFGSAEGAAGLLFADDPAGMLKNGCDIFNVAEIRRPREGALEIKFFDRLKALEKLQEIRREEKPGASDFYRAVLGGLGSAEGEEQEDEL